LTEFMSRSSNQVETMSANVKKFKDLDNLDYMKFILSHPNSLILYFLYDLTGMHSSRIDRSAEYQIRSRLLKLHTIDSAYRYLQICARH
jgi:hypothetical protein